MARVTIVGGGYGGITAAKVLDDVAEVTLVEQKDTFVSHAARCALRSTVTGRRRSSCPTTSSSPTGASFTERR